MTVIFGFTSNVYDASLIAADDRENIAGGRADKALCVFGRYLVAVMGNGALKHAVECAARFESPVTHTSVGTQMLAPASIEVLCNRIAETMTLLASRLQRDAERAFSESATDQLTRAQYDDQPLRAVIIDALEHRLVVADYGTLLPLRRYTWRIEGYPPETAFRFNIGDPTPLEAVAPALLDDVFAWCARQLEDARSTLERQGYTGVLGAVGACHLVRSGNLLSRTAFKSLEDFIRSHVQDLD